MSGEVTGLGLPKPEAYDAVISDILAVLEGEDNRVAKMATVSSLLAATFPERFFWTGFYCVDETKPDELVVGPYQGTLGCLRIAFGRGVCGTAAHEGKTQVVKDVHAVINHIACDSRTKSEIVVPVWNAEGQLMAVLDVDSTELAAFDDVDKEKLELLMKKVFM